MFWFGSEGKCFICIQIHRELLLLFKLLMLLKVFHCASVDGALRKKKVVRAAIIELVYATFPRTLESSCWFWNFLFRCSFVFSTQKSVTLVSRKSLC